MSSENTKIFGIHILSAARIAGFTGVGLSILTFVVALFVDDAVAIYLDAFFSILIYVCLVLIQRSTEHPWYLFFMGLNGTLIMFKFFYLLILTIVFVVRPTSYGTFPRQFSGYAGVELPDHLGEKSPLLGDVSGVLGTVDFNHDIGGRNSIADTVSGVLGTVKFDHSDRSTYYDNNHASPGYGRPMQISQLSTAVKLILVAFSLLFNCFSQFVAFCAFKLLKKSSVYAQQTCKTEAEGDNVLQTPPLKSAIKEKGFSPMPTTLAQHADVGGRVSAASRKSINTDV